MNRDRISALIVGRKRGGKSAYTEKAATLYPGEVIVYNHGRPTDFKNFTPAEWNGHSIEGKGKIKVPKIIGYKDQEKFFTYIAEKRPNTFLIIDDAINTQRRGVTSPAIERIFSTPDHIGIDVALIYHCLNLVPPALYSYATNIVQFRTMTEPKPEFSKRIPDFNIMVKNYKRLSALPKYYHFEVDLLNLKNTLKKPIEI